MGSAASGGSRTSAVAVPGVGRIMNRIAPFLGVERKAEPVAPPAGAAPAAGTAALEADLSALVDAPSPRPEIAGRHADSRRSARAGCSRRCRARPRTGGPSSRRRWPRRGGGDRGERHRRVGTAGDPRSGPAPRLCAGRRALLGRAARVCVAVTGTNGKTSVAAFCRQIFERWGTRRPAWGTLGVRHGETQLTPPGPDHARRRATRRACWPSCRRAA
jgi:hypothetical protein